EPQRDLLADEQARDRGQAKRRDGAVESVRGRHAEPGEEAGGESSGERPPDTQQAHRPDRRGDREAERDPQPEWGEIHAGCSSRGRSIWSRPGSPAPWPGSTNRYSVAGGAWSRWIGGSDPQRSSSLISCVSQEGQRSGAQQPSRPVSGWRWSKLLTEWWQ